MRSEGKDSAELLFELMMMGAAISYPTLNRYVKKGFVSSPKVANRGRGVGKTAIYPKQALMEAYYAKKLTELDTDTVRAAIKLLMQNDSD